MFNAASVPVVSSSDWDEYQGSNHSNNMWFLNDVNGVGSLVNGTDYYQRLNAIAAIFPLGAVIEYWWPETGGAGSWAFGYPKVIFGRSASGENPFSLSGPWGQKINTLTALSVTYDISISGNLQAMDILVDNFVHSVQNPTDLTTLVAELSFLPYRNLTTASGTSHDFTNYFAKVNNSGAGVPQIEVRPVTTSGGTTTKNNLSGTFDLLEQYNFMIAQGWLTGNEYMQGISFGVEAQSPASGISTVPHQGLLKINNLSYVWT